MHKIANNTGPSRYLIVPSITVTLNNLRYVNINTHMWMEQFSPSSKINKVQYVIAIMLIHNEIRFFGIFIQWPRS